MSKEKLEKAAFTTEEASQYTGLGIGTLKKGRRTGLRAGNVGTPPFIRLGRAIRYLKTDIDSWLQEHRVVMSGTKGVSLKKEKRGTR